MFYSNTGAMLRCGDQVVIIAATSSSVTLS
jgi:hypothetical protein